MSKITFIGAGSTVFAKNLLCDILGFSELSQSTITLFDIDPDRLSDTEIVAKRVAQSLDVNPKIISTTNQKEAMEGADYAICMIQVGGYRPATVIDFEIPKKYGLRQTIADTIGIGGIMRALRTIPVLLDMVSDMEKLCPEVTLLNYVNPLAINSWAINRKSKIKGIGLCHSVQATALQLAYDLGVPLEEINYLCAGINHMSFFLRLEQYTSNGVENLYPALHQIVADERVPDWNRVRYEALERLGFFVTESSEHFAEYTPWFIKRDRPDLIERYNIPLDEYMHRCEKQIEEWQSLQKELSDPEKKLVLGHSLEYGADIIHSIETGNPYVFYGNVPNKGLIDNLPDDCIVEVPCLVDKNGVQPTRIGSLPIHLAALIQTNINVQALTVEAALTRKREHIYHAAMLDPHTSAELDLDQIYDLVDELIEAHGDWLPEYV